MIITIDEEMKTQDIPIKRDVRQGDPISTRLFTLTLEEVFESLDDQYRWTRTKLLEIC